VTRFVDDEVNVVRGVDGADDQISIGSQGTNGAGVGHPPVLGRYDRATRVGLGPALGSVDLPLADCLQTVHELPGEVLHLDGVAVDQGHPADPQTDQ